MDDSQRKNSSTLSEPNIALADISPSLSESFKHFQKRSESISQINKSFSKRTEFIMKRERQLLKYAEKLEKQKKRLEDEKTMFGSTIETEDRRLRSETVEYSRKLSLVESESAEIQKKIKDNSKFPDQISVRFENLKRDLREADEEIKGLDRAVAEVRSLKGGLSRMESSINSEKAVISSQKERLSQLSHDQCELGKAESKIRQRLEKVRRDREESKEFLSKKLNELAEVQPHLAATKSSLLLESKEAAKRIALIRNKIESISSEISAAAREKANLEPQCKAVEAQMRLVQAHLSQWLKQLNEAQMISETSKKNLFGCSNKVESLLKQLSKIAKEKDTSKSQLENESIKSKKAAIDSEEVASKVSTLIAIYGEIEKEYAVTFPTCREDDRRGSEEAGMIKENINTECQKLLAKIMKTNADKAVMIQQTNELEQKAKCMRECCDEISIKIAETLKIRNNMLPTPAGKGYRTTKEIIQMLNEAELQRSSNSEVLTNGIENLNDEISSIEESMSQSEEGIRSKRLSISSIEESLKGCKKTPQEMRVDWINSLYLSIQQEKRNWVVYDDAFLLLRKWNSSIDTLTKANSNARE